MVKLNDYTNKLNLCEAGQTIETRMAYVHKEKDGTYTQLHDTVKCRDYLGDALHAEEQKKTVTIYGFSWNGCTQKIDRDSVRLMVDFKGNSKMLKTFMNNLSIFNTIEEQHKLTKTTVELVENRENVVIVTGSKFWIKSIFNISFYTFLIKAACYEYKNINNWQEELSSMSGVDAGYMKQTKQVFKFYVDNLKKFTYKLPSVSGYTKSYSTELSTHVVHNNSGFVSMRFFQGAQKTDENRLKAKMNKLWSKYGTA